MDFASAVMMGSLVIACGLLVLGMQEYVGPWDLYAFFLSQGMEAVSEGFTIRSGVIAGLFTAVSVSFIVSLGRIPIDQSWYPWARARW